MFHFNVLFAMGLLGIAVTAVLVSWATFSPRKGGRRIESSWILSLAICYVLSVVMAIYSQPFLGAWAIAILGVFLPFAYIRWVFSHTEKLSFGGG